MTRFENELAIILDYCSRNGAISNEDAVKIAKKYSARLLEMHDMDRMEDGKLGTIYIARDEGVCYDEGERKSQGNLHLFYDTPLINIDSQTNTRKFDCARCIAEIPTCILTLKRVIATKSAYLWINVKVKILFAKLEIE